MKELNAVQLTGNLTADPLLSHIPSGTAVVKFTIANNRDYKAGEVMNKKTNFIRCTAWAGAAETIAEYFKKGQKITVIGELDQQTWEDKKTGENRSMVGIKVNEFHFMGKKSESSEPVANDPGGYNKPFADDDIPF
jgi:single-strand DNA-binding protein